MKENKQKSEKKNSLFDWYNEIPPSEEKQVHPCPSAEVRHVSPGHLRQD